MPSWDRGQRERKTVPGGAREGCEERKVTWRRYLPGPMGRRREPHLNLPGDVTTPRHGRWANGRPSQAEAGPGEIRAGPP